MNRLTVHGLQLEVAGFSEQGPRPENQDAFTVDGFAEAGLLALADGMGGEKGGRVAADEALRTLLASAPLASFDEARRAVREADRAVAAKSDSDPDHHGGMGCALGVLSLVDRGDGPGWIAAHVGDVRILSRSPDGLLRLETRDHTPAFGRWEAGEIALDEVVDSAGANRLQRAVGRGGEADVTWLPAGAGWSWLVISDGVYKAMRLDELSAAMALPTAAEACEAIRLKVEERGADDNFTAVYVRALGGLATPIIDSTVEMKTSSTPVPLGRSRAGGIATALGLLAIVLSGIAFWTASQARAEAAGAIEMETLRAEVDSLRAIVEELRDPFGPTVSPLEPETTTTAPLNP
ncbi:MAG: protein phosphatase 2C domain-containing protein [Gemmatimonadota bacterium]